MSFRPSVSVVIVSQGRPEYLTNCLSALRHQTYPIFEIVLVADSLPSGFKTCVKFQKFDELNISKARNMGLSLAQGDIIAFCDDDAIPDQTWIERLIEPFEDSNVGSATGYTRGRNGISLQWGPMRFDRLGNDVPLETKPDQGPRIFEANPDCPLKILGTSMAIRRSALVKIKGFDEAFRYYLDETDVKIRLDEFGYKSALVPSAMVQHLSAPSQHRSLDKKIRDGSAIAMSKAYFCKKHYAGDPSDELEKFAEIRLPSDTKRKFRDGFELSTQYWDCASCSDTFLNFPTNSGPHVVITCGLSELKIAKTKAEELLVQSNTVTILQMLPSVRYFQAGFQSGYWLRRGGTFGKSIRSQPLFRFVQRKSRIQEELRQIHAQNPIDFVTTLNSGSFIPHTSSLSPLKDHKVEVY